MEILIYFGIGYGCNSAGWPYFRSLFRPVSVGRMIARRAQDGEGG